MVILSILTLLFISDGLADDNLREPEKDKWLSKHAFALQFGITENFALKVYQGSTISLKYHIQNDKAIRFGLSIGGGYSTSNNLETRYSQTTENKATKTTDEQTIDLLSQFIVYPSISNKITYFVGSGLVLGFSRYSHERENESIFFPVEGHLQYSYNPTEDDSYTLKVGISFIVGIEQRISNNFSFTAEYNSSINYSYRKSKRLEYDDEDASNAIYATHQNMRALYLLNHAVKFGLSYYF